LLIFVGKVSYQQSQIFFPLCFSLRLTGIFSLKQSDNRINILLLGIGGGTHDGPNLTDTIMLASIDFKADKVTLVSIPRDLWLPDTNQKINAAYAIG
jgi:anionic cell wall polymer biosynthesis LytR-Cps2A-Psr (LCP) family protein